MTARTTTELSQPRERDRVSTLGDVLERVVRTHLAPVTGLEEEVAVILGWKIRRPEERESG